MPKTPAGEFTAEGMQVVITSIAADTEAGRPFEAAFTEERLKGYLNQGMAGAIGGGLGFGPAAAVPPGPTEAPGAPVPGIGAPTPGPGAPPPGPGAPQPGPGPELPPPGGPAEIPTTEPGPKEHR